MWASFLGTIKRSLPTNAFPVAITRFSPLAVNGMSVTPVWRPLSDHSVSPWRTMKTRGVDMAGADVPSVLVQKEQKRSYCETETRG